MKRLALVMVMLALLPLTAVAASDPLPTVAAIHFTGNKVTNDKVMLREMVIHVGDPLDAERIERSRQAIMNLGLFKSVTASVEEGNVLLITVVERYYILPLPLLDARPEGDYSYGAELRFDNLAGLNQRFKLTYEEKDSVTKDLPHAKEGGITYAYPRLNDSAYQLDFSSKVKQYEFPWPDKYAPQAHYRIDAWNTSLSLSRWANDEGVSRGWRYGAGLSHQVNDYRLMDGSAGDLLDGQAVSLNATLESVEVDDYAFYRDGRIFGVRGELGMPILDSDFSFSREQVYYRAYHHLPSTGANINSQWQFGFANGCSFDCAAWKLGGGSTLRGYDSEYVSGNIFALANLEYHHPMSGFNQLRGVIFTDVGDAWGDMESMTLTHLKSSVGVGLRWTVQSFVDITLRADFAYGLDAQSYHGYFSTRASF
ncbi:MAG TPA: BamA/TamA family outer membrane protein [Gammaproteobacteria bacterium]